MIREDTVQYFIGIDVGTSGTKTILFDNSGTVIASACESYRLFQPQSGWAEQDPEDWWKASAAGIRRVLTVAKVPPQSIKGVGVSGQMHGLVMLDERDAVIRPAILWCDSRTKEQCRQTENLVGRKKLIGITANPPLECFTAQKLMWVRQYEPKNYAACRKIMLPKDYVNFKLTQRFATDVSDASGMQLMNIGERCWSDEILRALNIPREILPDLLESCQTVGTVSAAAAKETGLCTNTAVAAGAGDQAAAGVGSGIVSQGRAVCNVGTSGVIFAHTDSPLTDEAGRVHTFCHAVPDCWHVMGVTQGAGLSMRWFKDNFYANAQGGAYDKINADAADVPAGCAGLTYLPYLMGERTPHLDVNARGVFFGIDAEHTLAHFARAVMEGVSFSLLDCLNVIRALGINADEIRLAGGGAKSKVWRQMLCDVFETDCVTTNSTEAGCLGAAILASVASGCYRDVMTAVSKMVQTVDCLNPDKSVEPDYRRAYNAYTQLYPALKPCFAKSRQS